MNKREYLFNSTQEFFESSVWKGQRFYDAIHYRPWFAWIYIALYDHIGIEEYKKDPNPDVQIKIGQTSNIDRRNKELFRDTTYKGKTQKKASIVYVWSVPLSIRFENDLKTLLASYILQDTTRAQASEIITGIPVVPLINIIQLSIFKTCLSMRFIKSDLEFNLRPFDSILDAGFEYPGRRKYIAPHQLVMDTIFKQLDIKKGNTMSLLDYIFVKGTRIPIEEEKIDVPEFEGKYILDSSNMKGKVYPVGTYVYAKYTRDKKSSNYLAEIVGYADSDPKHKNQYAVKWLVTERGRPIREDGALEVSNYKWEWTTKVQSAREIGQTKILEEFPELKVGEKVDIPPLRL